MEAGASPPAQVAFEDVAVYFLPEEWSRLDAWQKDLYAAVMLENYRALDAVGCLSAKPELICRIEREEDPCLQEPPQTHKWRRGPPSPCLAGDGIRLEEEEGGEVAAAGQWRPVRGKRRKEPPPPGAEKLVPRAIKVTLSLPSENACLLVPLKTDPPQCPECGKSFLSNVALTIHIRTHTGERPFGCHLCPKGFPSAGDLKRHLKTHLRQSSPPPATPAGPKTCLTAKLQLLRQLGASPGPKRPHLCDRCGKSFNKKQDLRKHCGTHSSERPFPCPECGRRFRLKQILAAHLKVHVGERPFACGRCGKRFGQKHHVESHQRVHTGEKPFACTTCGKRYAQKQPLISHLRGHTGERPFVCAACGKAFRSQATLTIHQRVHTGERPYRCLLCSKACSQLQHLKSHQRVHRGEQHLLASGGAAALARKRAQELREKPHPCPRCEKRFRDESIMRTHLKTHQEGKCGSVARTEPNSALPVHGESPPSLGLAKKPAKCRSVAGRESAEPNPPFPVLAELTLLPELKSTGKSSGVNSVIQQRPTAGKHPVTCADCGRTFTQEKYLTLHRRSHK